MSQIYLKSNGGAPVSSSFVEDVGTAVPTAGGVLNIFGGTGISTSGSGNTVTISATSGIPDTFTADVGSATPVANNLNVKGAGGTKTSGSGSTITITSAGIISWVVETGTTHALLPNQGVFANNAAPVVCTLPAVSSVGDTIKIIAMGAGKFSVAQLASQQIFFDGASTTVGAGGSLTCLQASGSLTLVCSVANLTWIVDTSGGSFTIV